MNPPLPPRSFIENDLEYRRMYVIHEAFNYLKDLRQKLDKETQELNKILTLLKK